MRFVHGEALLLTEEFVFWDKLDQKITEFAHDFFPLLRLKTTYNSMVPQIAFKC